MNKFGFVHSIDELLQDSESESDDEEEQKAKGRGQKVRGRKTKKLQASQQGAAWLREGQQEDTPLDFLDPSVSKRVLGEGLSHSCLRLLSLLPFLPLGI